MKNIEIELAFDPNGVPFYKIYKKRGALTLNDIRQALTEYDQNFYMLVIKAIDEDMSQYYLDDGYCDCYAEAYVAGDFFNWRSK